MTDRPKCGCGRSPNGYCLGWHKLTEEEFKLKLQGYNTAAQQLTGKTFTPVDKSPKRR